MEDTGSRLGWHELCWEEGKQASGIVEMLERNTSQAMGPSALHVVQYTASNARRHMSLSCDRVSTRISAWPEIDRECAVMSRWGYSRFLRATVV